MNIDQISVEEIVRCFSECNSNKEVLERFGKKPNGSGSRFIAALREKAGINWRDYFKNTGKDYYEEHKKHCLTCGKEIPYEQHRNVFCSHSCSAVYNNIKRGKRSKETCEKISRTLLGNNSEKNIKKTENKLDKKHITHCKNCGKEIHAKSRNTAYCSNSCYLEKKRKEKISRWLNGENFVKGGHQIPSFIREYLLKLHKNKCEKCGWSETNKSTGLIPLQIHHIDGDCTNNHIENLQVLCPNCHSLTDTFGSLNKDSKRFHRSKKTKKDI